MKKFHILSSVKAVFLASVFGLAACGGGGGGGSSGGGGTETPPAPPIVKVFSGALQTAGSRDGVGTQAQFNRPVDVAQDAAGNVYVADSANNTIRKITPQGVVTTLAGAPGQAGSADGSGADARFGLPTGIAVSEGGTVYVSDTGNHTIRKISPGGVVTTIAGAAGQAGDTDGNAAVARFNFPGKLAVDTDGTIYVSANYAVRRISPDGAVSTFAGKSGERDRVSGNGARTRFIFKPSVAVGGGNVYVAQSAELANGGGGDIRKFSTSGEALPFGASPNGVLSVSYPADIAADAQGVYFVSNGADQASPSFFTVYRAVEFISADGLSRTTFAGTTNDARTVDGPGTNARFSDPRGIAIGPGGRLVIAEANTNAIRTIAPDASRTVTTLAGGDGSGYVDGAAASARFNTPGGIAAAADGTLYVADLRNRVVRKIGPSGTVSTLAVTFNGVAGTFARPESVAVGGTGVVYVLEQSGSGRQVWAIDNSGRASRFYSADLSALVIASDAAGNLYLNERLEMIMIAPDGTRRVLATGIGAQGLAVDRSGNVFFAASNSTVNRIDPLGRSEVRAGRAGTLGYIDATGSDALFSRVGAVALDPAGNLYVVDGSKIRKVSPLAEVTTVADLATLEGLPPESVRPTLLVTGLAWAGGALYGIVQNALIQIAPAN